MRGRRLPDTPWGSLPGNSKPGDYWKCTNIELKDGTYPTNLTRTVWQYYSPDGNGMGTLMKHTVREEDDGSITVRPNDGSSNSIRHSGGSQGKTWHGYVDKGYWIPVG